MAKYHWNRITDDPEMYRDLMVNPSTEEDELLSDTSVKQG